VKDTDAAAVPSTLLAISSQVVAISGPPSVTHRLVTSGRLDSEEGYD
jgi:hypothetical protein